MPDRNKYALGYRPESYWDEPERLLLANIKGEHRRRKALELIRDGQLETLDKWLIAERLPDEVREALGRIHPVLMGGEYLPDSAGGEVEVARISLQSTTSDVISIRARRTKDNIEYRVVDEYDTVFKFQPKNSKDPLALCEMIDLIDSVEHEGLEGLKGLTSSFRDMNLQIVAEDPEGTAQRARELVDFVTVTSSFYSELERWYHEEALEWLQEHK